MLAKHERKGPESGPIGNTDPNKRGRGGDNTQTGQPQDDGKHSDTNKK